MMRRPKEWTPDKIEKQRLLSFEGYGPDTSDIVFIGLEEHCSGDPDMQRDSIWIRCTHQEFAAKRADKNRAVEALSGLIKANVPVWDVMAAIVSGLTGRPCNIERYDLGTRPAASLPLSTWLTWIRPLPRQGSAKYAATYIPEWFGDDFERKADYIAKSDVIASKRLPAALSISKPKYVFFYGADAKRWAHNNFSKDLLRVPFSAPYHPHIEVAETTFGTKLACTYFYKGRHPTRTFGLRQVNDLLRSLGA